MHVQIGHHIHVIDLPSDFVSKINCFDLAFINSIIWLTRTTFWSPNSWHLMSVLCKLPSWSFDSLLTCSSCSFISCANESVSLLWYSVIDGTHGNTDYISVRPTISCGLSLYLTFDFDIDIAQFAQHTLQTIGQVLDAINKMVHKRIRQNTFQCCCCLHLLSNIHTIRTDLKQKSGKGRGFYLYLMELCESTPLFHWSCAFFP